MRVVAALVAFAAAPAAVLAWGAAGHEIVATIAEIYLLPSAHRTVCLLLHGNTEPCHLAAIATWADRVRGLPQYRWSGSLHYANPAEDHPPQHCTYGEAGWQGARGANVLGAVRNTTDWLVEGRPGAGEALRFLVHFLGDMHMPLHQTGRAKGGNGARVRFDKRQTNLHSVWDNYLVAKAIRETPANYTRRLPSARVERALTGAIYDPYVRMIVHQGLLGRWRGDLASWASCPEDALRARPRAPMLLDAQTVLAAPPSDLPDVDDALVCPYAWGAPVHDLVCEFVWPKELDGDDLSAPRAPLLELDTPEYAGRIRNEWLVERLLATAGIRLAAVLNDIYAEEGDFVEPMGL